MALTQFEEKVLNSLGRHSVSISEIEEGFFMTRPSRSLIQRTLKRLIKKKLVVMTGQRRGTRSEKVKR